MRSLLVLGLVLALLGPSLGAVPPPVAARDWREVADARLQAAAIAGQADVSVLLQGPPLALPAEPPISRAAWAAHWAAASEPFLAAVRAQAARVGGRVTSEVAPIDAAFVRVSADRVPALIAGVPGVLRAGLDRPDAVHTMDVGMSGTASLDQALAMMRVQALWAQGFRGEGIKIAIVDTGIRWTHEMFKWPNGSSRVVAWADVTVSPGGSGYCASPCDANGHGTHTASTAAGSALVGANNQSGAAPRADILGIRIFQGSSGSWEATQAGLQRAFNMGANLSSNSWGGDCAPQGVPDYGAFAAADLAESLTNAGMLSVFAAGNAGGDRSVHCPAVAPGVISVGAVDLNGNLASFSSRGPCAWPRTAPLRWCPDVVAMGVSVNAATNGCDTCYLVQSGTSMATPQVAGLAALLMQARASLGGAPFSAPDHEAEILLRHTARDLGPPGPDDSYGWGVPNGTAAYDVLAQPVPGDLRVALRNAVPVLSSVDTSFLRFIAANLGAVPIAGATAVTARQLDTGTCPPTCDFSQANASGTVAPLREQEVVLSFYGLDHAAGRYAVEGTFAGNHTDPASHALIQDAASAAGTLLLARVSWEKIRDVPPRSPPGTPLTVHLTLRNAGNVAVYGINVKEFIPVPGFAPVACPCGSGDTRYAALAAPAPTAVAWHNETSSISYEWTPWMLQPGEAWTATYQVVAAAPGNYTFNAAISFVDELGHNVEEPFAQPADVGVG